MLNVLLALALIQAGPIETAPRPAGAATAAAAPADPTAAAAGVTPASAEDGEIPKGAPEDDYDFVAWCHGALSGHMTLYQVVKPELKSIERPDEVAGDEQADREQLAAGREYLALYSRAMRAAAKSHPKEMTARRLKFEAQGEAIWTPAKAAEPRTRMWSWLLWDLPGRCEIAAKRLEGRSGVLGAALKANAPASTAEPAPTDAAPPPLRGPQ
jgi:hypothetical protein